jgi:hypothetical protein
MPKRNITMSLDDVDLEMARGAEQERFTGNVERISFLVATSGTVNPYTDEFVPGDEHWVAVSGSFHVLSEGDVLIGMGGKVTVGDYIAKFYYPDVISYVDVEKVRREKTGEVFTVEGRIRAGLGPQFTRLELGLKLKPNE